jgi:hypothetical protein
MSMSKARDPGCQVRRSTIERIRPLILLLGSDQGGEVVAAANALVKTLKADGRDLYDLCATLVQPLPAPKPERTKPEPKSKPRQEPEPDPWRVKAAAITRHDREHSSLREHERRFVQQIINWRSKPSEKQLNWLDNIYSKIFTGDK